MTTKHCFYLLVFLPLALVFGCGGSKGTVAKMSGIVKYKGNPVTGGTMILSAKEGGTYSIVINPDGTYSSSQLPTGETAVAIETESLSPNRPKPQQYGAGKGGKGGGMSPVPEGAPSGSAVSKGNYVKIPKKYADSKTSGLTVTLNKGENPKDFDLTD